MAYRGAVIFGVFLWSSAGVAGGGNAVSSTEVASPSSLPLSELVESFFHTADPRERQSLVALIEDSVGGSIDAVAEAIEEAQVWPALPIREGVFSFGAESMETVSVAYRLPAAYDPKREYPVVYCLPDQGASATNTFALAGEALGESLDGFVLVCPDRPIGGVFHEPVTAAEDFRRFVRQGQRRIHTDTDRAFLFGSAAGGEAAWMTAIAHPDLFAGAVILSAYPPAPYPEQVYPFLLENLRRVPVLTVWSSADPPAATARQKAVAAYNQAIVRFAKRVGLPLVGVEVPPQAPQGLKPPADQVARILQGKRGPVPRQVSHWFRYPAQGNAGWLKLGRFRGEVWEGDQLSILPSPATDHDTFIAEVFKTHLGYLGGRIDGQTITIEARRCARVEVLLPEGLVEWDRPFTVYCNGKKRHGGPLQPSIQTLLETAFQEWDFHRLPVARLSFSVRTDALEN